MRRIGGNQLFFRAVAIAHTDGIHAVRPAAFDIEAAVANHHDAAAECFHAPADKRRLAGILVIQPRPDHVVQIRRETKFFRDALGENLRLCGDDRHARAVFFETAKQRGNAGIHLVFRPADTLKPFMIIIDRPIGLLIRHSDDRAERIKQRRADKHLELLLCKAGEAHLFRRVNRGFRNALFRLGERSIQIKKNCRILHRLLLLAFSAASGRLFSFGSTAFFAFGLAFFRPARGFLLRDNLLRHLRFAAADQRRHMGINLRKRAFKRLRVQRHDLRSRLSSSSPKRSPSASRSAPHMASSGQNTHARRWTSASLKMIAQPISS